MKFAKALALFVLAFGLTHAESQDECKELKSIMKEKFSSRDYVCKTNKEGKIEKLQFEDEGLEEKDFEKIQSYDTIKELSYSVYDELPLRKDPKGFNSLTNLKNLKNLEKLTLTYNCNYNPCTTRCIVYHLNTIGKNVFKDLESLKELNVFGIKLSQNNIDEISTLKNLESLSLDYCTFDLVEDFSSLSKLKKVTNLSSIQSISGYENSDSDTVPGEFVNEFKNAKVLNIDNGRDINYKQFVNVEKMIIDYEEDTSFLKDFKKLKELKIKPKNDLSVLKYVDSLKRLTIYYEPTSHGYASFPYQDTNYKFSEKSNIESLHLYGVTVTDDDFSEILKLKKLKSIKFENCDLILNEKNSKMLENFENKGTFEIEDSTTTTKGKCGKDYGKCPSGQCCSRYG